MSDNLRDRIAVVLSEHVENQLTNYDAERNECGCGHQGDATYRDHLADAVIRTLELQYEYENGRVMYTTKPAACKANGNWQVRIASPFKLYEGGCRV